MPSLVEELQRDSLNPKVSVTELLRKAKVIAVKLGLDDFSAWIDKELAGYTDQDDIPAYRTISGEPKAFNPFQGWQPIIFQSSEHHGLFSKRPIAQPLAELEDLSKSGTQFQVPYSPEMQQHIMEAIGHPLNVSMMVQRAAIIGILEAARNAILGWSLKLEQSGIVGEGMSFSQKDRQKAHDPSTVYKINRIENFTGMIGGALDHSTVAASATIGADLSGVRQLISDIRKYESELKLGQAEATKLEDALKELEIETAKDRPGETRVRGLLVALKSVIEKAAAGLLTQGILFEIGKHLR
jgi:hypothetical protein